MIHPVCTRRTKRLVDGKLLCSQGRGRTQSKRCVRCRYLHYYDYGFARSYRWRTNNVCEKRLKKKMGKKNEIGTLILTRKCKPVYEFNMLWFLERFTDNAIMFRRGVKAILTWPEGGINHVFVVFSSPPSTMNSNEKTKEARHGGQHKVDQLV